MPSSGNNTAPTSSPEASVDVSTDAGSSGPASRLEVLGKAGAKKTGADQLLHLERYSVGARQVIVAAQKDADARHQEDTTVLHLLHQLLSLEPLKQLCRDAGADPDAALTAIAAELPLVTKSEMPSKLSRDALAVLKDAEQRAGAADVALRDVLLAAVASGIEKRTVADLDKDGIGSDEHRAVAVAVAKGRLDRILSTKP